MKRTSLLVILAGCCAALPALEWQLPGIAGDAPDKWKDGPNWRFEAGNPLSDKGATWGLLYQPSVADPALKPMVAGKAYKFHFVWRDEGDSFDPATFYKERTLKAASRADGPGQGPVSALVFAPGKAASYRVALAGTIAMQSPTAGNARAILAVVDGAGAVVKELKAVELNAKGGHGGFPAELAWDDTVALAAGQGFALRLQTVNPGPATAGWCSLAISSFTVTRVE